MSKDTNLTFTLQGVSENEGKINVIDTKDQDLEAIMVFTFKQKNDEIHTFGMSAIGSFSMKCYIEIIQHLMQTIGRDNFMRALMLSEIMSKMDKSKEKCGGGGMILNPSPAI